MPRWRAATELGTNAVAHGCTGMGNDQVRFDLAVKALGDYAIVAPIREIQKEHTQTRAYEQAYLEAARLRRARQAEGLHDQREPARADHVRRRDRPLGSAGRGRARLVRAARRVAGGAAAGHARASSDGVAVALDGERDAGRADAGASSTRCSRRTASVAGIYTGDTTIGLKGRIVFEAPGPDRAAGRASRAGGGGAEQAAEPLQARGRAQVGRAGLRGLLPRPAQDRPRSLPRAPASAGQRRGDARDPRRPRRRGGGALAAHPQRQGRDLRAVGRLGRGRGRGLHQAVSA